MIDQTLIETEFPQEDGLYYLNHAGVAPWPSRTATAVKRFAEENITKGAKDYANWVEAERTLRKQLQTFINAPSVNDIALLKNTSECLSIVACGLDWHEGDNVVSSNEEFPSNRIPWEAQARHGVAFRAVDLNVDDPEQALMNACDEKTRILTISSVQYASGLQIDLRRLGAFCRDNDIRFCVDAIQSLGAIKMDVQAINADFIMADGHKWMLGPEGIALFYCAESVRDEIQLNQFGWHMVEQYGNYDRKDWTPARTARRFECGSNNLMGVHALSASLSLFEEIGMDAIEAQILDNSRFLIERLGKEDQIEVMTPSAEGTYAGIVTFKVDAMDHAALHQALLKQNLICAHRGGGIRFSPHFYMGRDNLNKVLEILILSI